MSKWQEVTILLAEDDPGHTRLIEKNLRRSGITNEIIPVNDGRQALDYLLGEGEYAGEEHSSPVLLVLDLNMPVLDGYQVLERMRVHPRTRHVPVIVLTTTDDAREVARCYELGCNVYVTKPVDYQDFSQAVRNLGLFLSIVTIPAGDQESHVQPSAYRFARPA